MHCFQTLLVWAFVEVLAQAVPLGNDLVEFSPRAPVVSYSIPQNDPNKTARAAGVTVKQAGFLYGPVVGTGGFAPTGPLGLGYVASDVASLQTDETADNLNVTQDAAQALADSSKYNGLQTLEDYTLLYDGEWTRTLPFGPDKGMLTNYTQDLLFSMERLSFSPYAVRRLNSTRDKLQFTIPDATSIAVTGQPFSALFSQGRLFYADFRAQANLTRTVGKYGGACDAFFYINQTSHNFLPLAIRTNYGANLIYTPADNPSDWLFAKILYNVNDFFFDAWHHLAATHDVLQISYMSAYRTLSDEHPVLAILQRLNFQNFGVNPAAIATLFTPGTTIDMNTPFTGLSAQNYTQSIYQNGAGAFQSNYFLTDLYNRGLIGSSGPALQNFPFFEDGGVIYAAQTQFFATFVNSYYANDSVVASDSEIQAWVKEANGVAKVIAFPATITTRLALIQALTHVAHLTSTAHHSVNTNQLLEAAGVLPLHPLALYKQLPTTKGGNETANLASFLPPLQNAVPGLMLEAGFVRPAFISTNRSLIHMFDNSTMLAALNSQTNQAAATFRAEMQAFSHVVANRKFDAHGLSQGMPFIWRALDPNVAPFSTSA